METKQVLTTKVSREEKASFLYLCGKEGLKLAPALHSLVVEAIKRGGINKVNWQPAINDRDTIEETDKGTSQKRDKSAYMGRYGISKMK